MCKHCWDGYNFPNHSDFIRGGVEASDFDDEVRYRRPNSGRRYGRSPKRRRDTRGCPANEGKGHVYVWTSEREVTDIFFKHFGFHKKESKVCAGCGVVSKTRETEEYMKRKERAWRKRTGGEFNIRRGEPVSRYRRWGNTFWGFNWEMLDPEYKAKYDAWHEEQRQKWLRRTEWTPFPRY